jgi:hypothetical protein
VPRPAAGSARAIQPGRISHQSPSPGPNHPHTPIRGRPGRVTRAGSLRPDHPHRITRAGPGRIAKIADWNEGPLKGGSGAHLDRPGMPSKNGATFPANGLGSAAGAHTHARARANTHTRTHAHAHVLRAWFNVTLRPLVHTAQCPSRRSRPAAAESRSIGRLKAKAPAPSRAVRSPSTRVTPPHLTRACRPAQTQPQRVKIPPDDDFPAVPPPAAAVAADARSARTDKSPTPRCGAAAVSSP